VADELRTERLTLRPVALEDLEDYAAMYAHPDVVRYLGERGVSREWFPERLVVLDALPRASGGKVAKGELREKVRTLVEVEESA